VRVVCFYARLRPETRRTLELYAPSAELIETPVDDDYSYWKALADCWTGEDDLMIVEQDIELTAGSVSSMMLCPGAWCTFSYLIGPETWAVGSLGCAKFSASLQRVLPAALIAAQPRFCVRDDYVMSGPDVLHAGTVVTRSGCPCNDASMPCWLHVDVALANTFGRLLDMDPHVHGTLTHHFDPIES
jgi:hypothetical protein